MREVSELALIRLIREASAGEAAGLIRGIGDDCAVFGGSATGAWLITTDTLVEGVHFDPRWHGPELLGRKSVAVNLSDIAAMGGTPRFVLLSLCLPPALSSDWLQRWFSGATARMAEYGCRLIGGDTVRGCELVISVTVLGEAAASGPLYRSGARPGDLVHVSGPLGSAAAGLALFQKIEAESLDRRQWPQWQPLFDAHLDPVPLVGLGQRLAASGCVTAMQDISDGLATDLAHICEESKTGVILHAERLPFLPVLDQAALFTGSEKLDLLLKGGEDYQLLFTVAPDREQALRDFLPSELRQRIQPVGVITEGCGVFLETGDGSRTEITFQGYEH